MLPRLLLLALTLVASQAASAQSFRHLDERHEPTTYATLKDWLGRAEEIREHILVSNGLWPMPEKTPLDPALGKLHDQGDYTVQGVRLETHPGFYLTGTLFRPKGEGPFPAILTAHGHWSTGRFEHSDLASIPGRSIAFAKQGYVVLSYSMIGYNETKDLLPHRFDEPAFQLWGFSAMGLQLWNSIRALDYLAGLPEVDASRIGMTGASGGGTQTFLLTAIDDRITVAAPVNMISAHFQGGCICENAPLLRMDANNVEIGALAAPRPLMMISTSGDWTMNTPDVEYPAVKRIYELFEAGERVANTHLDYPHNYNQDSREAVYAWFNRWLKDDPAVVVEPRLKIPKPSRLEAPAPESPASLDALFAGFKQSSAAQFTEETPDTWSAWNDFAAQYGEAMRHVLGPASGDQVTLNESETQKPKASGKVVLIVRDTDANTGLLASAWTENAAREGVRTAMLTPYPEGDRFVPPDTIEYWTTYNPSVAAKRIAEIRAAAQQLYDRPDVEEVELVGLGDAGVWTLLARTQLPFVRHAHIDFNHKAYESDGDFLENADIPLIRRIGDVKTAVALSLPDRLTIENLPEGEVRSWIERLYAGLGAGDLVRIVR